MQVRCLYSSTALTLKWNVRKASPFVAKDLTAPERLFTHDQGADVVSFYFQGDPNAQGSTPYEGRDGDARFSFGIFNDGNGGLRTIGVGFYPKWNRAGAQPQTYHTVAGGYATYEHVGEIPGAVISGEVDPDSIGLRCATKTLNLNQGWNVILCRAYCNGYPKFRIGLRLRADESVLCSLKTAAFAD